jgi:ferredoxin
VRDDGRVGDRFPGPRIALLLRHPGIVAESTPAVKVLNGQWFPGFVSCVSVTYVIAGSCIKDDSCIEVCPVDCIHPKPGAPDFETAEQLYIDPEVCIDCDACVEACPVIAIFPDFELPDKFAYALELNAEFFAEQGTAERTAA